MSGRPPRPSITPVTLRSGDRVLLRPVRPEDKDRLLDTFRRLTPQSRYCAVIRAPDARADSLVEVAIPLIRERVEQRRALPAPEVYEKQIQAIIAAGEKALAKFEGVAADRSQSRRSCPVEICGLLGS